MEWVKGKDLALDNWDSTNQTKYFSKNDWTKRAIIQDINNDEQHKSAEHL